MAISTSYEWLKEKYNPTYWNSFEEFEDFWLRWRSETLADTNYYTKKDGTEIKISPVNHFPELKEYEVWMSGFAVTGQSQGASLLGIAKARNFGQACHIVMCQDKLDGIKKENDPDNKNYVTPARWDYDPSNLSYWACKLYWSLDIAQRSFG